MTMAFAVPLIVASVTLLIAKAAISSECPIEKSQHYF